MKTFLISLMIFVAAQCMAQANKPEAGDFGLRYSVSFNGTEVQGLTFSGMATAHWEVGCGINVQYSKTSATTNNTTYEYTYVNNISSTIPAQQTTETLNQTLNTSLTPFVFYHFRIKNNLDIYCGPNLIIGTGSHTLISSNKQVTQGPDYYSENYSKQRYPLGYQVGGGINAGGQYFFYKRLALGVQAGLGVAYSYTNGNERAIFVISNSGANNHSSLGNINSTASLPYTNRSLSLTTASSIGINLTFYLGQKAKAAKKVKEL